DGLLGNIAPRPIAVGATTNIKSYDGTKSAAATPVVTSGALQGNDTAVFIETYNDKSAGTAKLLTPVGTVNDNNGGANYSVAFVPSTIGTINPRSLIVSATGVDKVYDGNSLASVSLSDNRISGDNLTESYASASFEDKNVGPDKPVNVSGISAGG